MIHTANLLLVTDSALLGSQRHVKIENIQALPPQRAGTVLRAEVVEANGQNTTLRLADGRLITADITPQLPVGSRLTLLPQPDGTASLLRYLAPPAKPAPQQAEVATRPGSAAPPAPQAQPTPPAPQPALPPQTPLLHSAVRLPQVQGAPPLPQVGTTLNITVAPGNPAPAVGASVLGRITDLPDAGRQTLELVSKTRLQVAVPPIFPQRSEVQVNILSPQTARIERLTTPVLAELPVAPAQPAQPPPLAEGARPLTPLPPLPLSPAGAPQQGGGQPVVLTATVVAGEAPHTTTLRLPEGQLLKLNIPQPVPEGQPVAIRIRADGLVDILPVTRSAPSPAVGQNPTPNTPLPQGQGQGAPQAGAPTSIPTAPPPPVLAQATVAAGGQNGTYTLRFDNGLTVQVHSERPLLPNAQLTVNLTAEGHAEIVQVALPKAANPKAAGLLNLALGWPALSKTVQALQRDNPQALADLKSRLPAMDATALPNLLRFAEAVTTRNLEALFGRDTLNILRALGLDGALSADLSTLHTLQQKTDQPDLWRGFVFPYWNDEDDHPRQGQFFWRTHDEAEGSEADHVRFVFNFSLSQLGSLQLDGLMHERTLALKLRTLNPLTEQERVGLLEVVRDALTNAGLSGGIEVEAVTHFEVDPVHDIAAVQKNLDLTV
jgi:hypothetical protein